MTDSDRDFLKKQGYTNVKMVEGNSMELRCGAMETWAFNTKFKAINPSGKEVTGTVCHFGTTYAVED